MNNLETLNPTNIRELQPDWSIKEHVDFISNLLDILNMGLSPKIKSIMNNSLEYFSVDYGNRDKNNKERRYLVIKPSHYDSEYKFLFDLFILQYGDQIELLKFDVYLIHVKHVKPKFIPYLKFRRHIFGQASFMTAELLDDDQKQQISDDEDDDVYDEDIHFLEAWICRYKGDEEINPFVVREFINFYDRFETNVTAEDYSELD